MTEFIDKVLVLIRGEVVALQRYVSRHLSETVGLREEVRDSLREITRELKNQSQPVINVTTPEVRVPDVIVPPLKVPDVQMPPINVTVPPIEIPKIEVPKPDAPIVNVAPPEVHVEIPDQVTVRGFREFVEQLSQRLSEYPDTALPYDRYSPLPVILVDKSGNEYRAGGGSVSVRGGGGSSSSDPTEQFKISDLDDASNPKYYGFIDRDGHWYILKEDTTAKTYRYVAGASDYATNWTNRASLAYDYFHNVF